MKPFNRGTRVFKSAVDGKFYATDSSPDNNPLAFMHKAALMPTDISDIEATVVLDEVLGLARPMYTMREVCRPISMDQLVMSIDIASAYTGHEKVDPMEEADIKKQSYSRTNFDLWKNVVHIVVADEAQKKASHDVLGLNIGDAAKELARMEDSQIKTIAEAATLTSAGSDWGGANNPYDDIMTAFASIEGTYGFEPTHMIAHPYVWMDFFSNDDVKGQLQGTVLPSGKIFDVPGLPGLTGVSSWQATNTQCLIVSKTAPALVLGQGPIEAAQYRNEKAGYDAYIVRQWLEPKIVQEGAIYELTGVHA